MSYLKLILDEAMANGGKLKLTVRGYLPAKIVKQANALLPNFAVANNETEPSISEFQGRLEDKNHLKEGWCCKFKGF